MRGLIEGMDLARSVGLDDLHRVLRSYGASGILRRELATDIFTLTYRLLGSEHRIQFTRAIVEHGRRDYCARELDAHIKAAFIFLITQHFGDGHRINPSDAVRWLGSETPRPGFFTRNDTNVATTSYVNISFRVDDNPTVDSGFTPFITEEQLLNSYTIE